MSNPLFNILEDDTIPIRVANVTEKEIRLTDGLVLPASCIFLNGGAFIWKPPPVDPTQAMPNGRGWEDWNEDAFLLCELVSPRPGKQDAVCRSSQKS